MNTKLKKAIVFFLIFLIFLSQTGCWSNRPLRRRAFVVAVGIDKGAENDIKITLQLVNPSNLNPDRPSGDIETTTWVHSTTGTTPFEAIRETLKVINRKPFYSHMQLLVIGDELAREGLENVIDFFERDPEIRLSPFVLIARDTTGERILKTKTELSLLPAMHIAKIVENNPESNPEIIKVKMIDLIKAFNHKGIEATAGVVSVKNEKEELLVKDLQVSDAAVFKGSKVIGYLSSENTLGLSYVLNESKNPILYIPNPLEDEKLVSIEQIRSKSNVDVVIEDDKFTGIISIKAEGNIGGQQGKGDLTTQENLEKLEDEVTKYIVDNVERTISVVQEEFGSDIFGFGQIVHRNYKDVWKEVENDWNDYFKEMSIKVNVVFNIRRTGLITKPSEY